MAAIASNKVSSGRPVEVEMPITGGILMLDWLFRLRPELQWSMSRVSEIRL